MKKTYRCELCNELSHCSEEELIKLSSRGYCNDCEPITLAEIKEMTWSEDQAEQSSEGRLASGAKFTKIISFIMFERNPIAERAEALRIFGNRGLGGSRREDVSDEDLVKEYMDLP